MGPMHRFSTLITTFLSVLAVSITAAARSEPVPRSVDPVAHGEPGPDAELTLREVVRRTATAETGIEVVAAKHQEARALELNASGLVAGAPEISAFSIGDGLWTHDGYQQYQSGLDLPLWWPGQRGARRQIARAAVQAAGESGRAHLLLVSSWVRQSVGELVLSLVRRELAEAQWKSEERWVSQIERAVAMQELAQRDLLLARSSCLQRRMRYLEAVQEFRRRADAYVLLTGLSEWPEDWTESPAEVAVFAGHPLLFLASENVSRAEGELHRAQRDQWGHPILTLGTQHERPIRGARFDHRIVAGLRIPIGRRSDARAEIAAASRALAEAKRDRSRLERELRGKLSEAEHRLSLASERDSNAARQAGISADYLRLIERGFELGETDIGTLLRARDRANSAEQVRREARVLRQFGVAELNQALGVVP